MAIPLMVLGPAPPAGPPVSTALITATVNSATTTNGRTPEVLLSYEMVNETGGRSGMVQFTAQGVYPPGTPGKPSTITQSFAIGGAMLLYVYVSFGTYSTQPLPGPSSLNMTITVNDGYGVNHAFPVLLSGGAAGQYLSTNAAQLVPVWVTNPNPSFFGWNAQTAFNPPWSLTGVAISNGQPGSTGGVVVIGMDGQAQDFTFTIAGNGTATVVINPPIQMDQNSGIGFDFTTLAGTLGTATFTGYGPPPAPPAIPADGAQAGDGTDPKLIVQISNDGGATWGVERAVAMGRIGQYRRLARVRQGGRSNNRVYRVICSEPVDAALVAAELDATPGTLT